MIRKIQYHIGLADEGKTIGTFLSEKEYSRAIIIELKKTKKGIRKNGEWATVREKLKNGDLLEIELVEEENSDQIIPVSQAFHILYEDEDILVINKPSNMPIHPSINHYEGTLANAVMHYYKEQDKNHVFRCINRLDRDTTGVTIIAKHGLSSSILSKRMQERKLTRTYLALVEGKVPLEGTIDLPIGRTDDSIIKRKVDEKEGERAITHYRRMQVLEVDEQTVSVVALTLETGRTHQIRVHMSHEGYPLLGDFLYNEKNHMLSRQALHAWQISFNHPISGRVMAIKAPLPEDMAEILKKSGVETTKLHLD